MVTGLITGPNRIPDLKIIEAMSRPGVYEFHLPEEEREKILVLQQLSPPVIYYPADLATDRREGRLFSVAQNKDASQVSGEAPGGQVEFLPGALDGVQLELVPEEQVFESLAA